MNRILLSFCLFLILLTSCKKETDQVTSKSGQKEWLAFSFQPSANPALSVAVDGQIVNGQVTLTLPPRTAGNALKATFSVSPLATVTINGVKQERGITVNDFTNPLTYRVTAENRYTHVCYFNQYPIPGRRLLCRNRSALLPDDRQSYPDELHERRSV